MQHNVPEIGLALHLPFNESESENYTSPKHHLSYRYPLIVLFKILYITCGLTAVFTKPRLCIILCLNKTVCGSTAQSLYTAWLSMSTFKKIPENILQSACPQHRIHTSFRSIALWMNLTFDPTGVY